MTSNDTEGFSPERWTYGGQAAGRTRARVAVWYDENRAKLLYAPDKGARYVPGAVYEVQVRRDGDQIQRLGAAVFQGRNPDPEWAAQVEAGAYAGDRQIAADALERRAARDTELDKLLAPVEAAAAGMTYAQRDALIALVTRRVYRANPERSKR
jgi:hypothetical protein